MMTSSSPIGIFDSGVGGISILREIRRLMPLEKNIYLADSKNAPYGERSPQEIFELCSKNTECLLSKGCKIIVVACNTATTNAIAKLRKTYEIPFIGIEPAIKPAILHSEKKRVGILATKGTLSSALFAETSGLYASNTEIVEVEGKGLVKAIEAGKLNENSTLTLLRILLEPITDRKVDCLVLGCTHYPFLIPLLKNILPGNVKIIDSGKAVARQTQSVLRASGILATTNQGLSEYYTNGALAVLKGFIEEENALTAFLNF